ncbi:MAG: DNA primase [Candidatus Blackburnbacteria bacterium]|nr:DNA primase [Candidatus Blackburnbacteria bacterium]
MAGDQIEEIKRKTDIVEIIGEYVDLKKAGRNYKGLCPFHGEKTPSFMVSQELQIFKCFGCFPAGQYVKTPFGYHKIEEIVNGEYVISGKGHMKKVLVTHERKYKGNLVTVKTSQLSEPVTLTGDHFVYVIGGSFLYRNNYKYFSKRLNFYRKYSSARVTKKIAKYFPVKTIKALDLTKGMSLLYPIDKTIRDIEILDLSQYITKKWPPHGTKPLIPPLQIEIKESLLKLIGYYIAEGSAHRAYIRFSLGSHEEDFASEIIHLVKKVFGISASIYRRPENSGKSGLEVTACNSILANVFEELCGKGAENKHVPFVFCQLPLEKQKVLLEAIYKGDGTRVKISQRVKTVRYSITTVSRTLSEQLVDVLLRLGYFPSRSVSKEKFDKKNIHHKSAFTVSWSTNPKVSKFHHVYLTDEGVSYWILPILEVSKGKFSGEVYNLTVDEEHSYVANNFAVANCGVGGDVYKFLEDYEKIDFPQALKILADRAGVKLRPIQGFAGYEVKEELYKVNFLTAEFYHYLLTAHPLGEPARQYLAGRGITLETVKLFKIGFAPDRHDTLFNFLAKKRGYKPEIIVKAGLSVLRNGQYFDRFRGRVIFPLSDHYGNILGFSGRVIRDGGEIAKYINSPDTLVYKKGNNLFGLNITKQDIKKAGFAVVVEGEFDLLSSYQANVANVVAIKGSAFTPEQAELISRFCPQVYLALDADFAGDQAARRGIDILKKAGVDIRVVKLGEGSKDPDDFARQDAESFKNAVLDAQSIYDFLIRTAFSKFDSQTTEGKEKISRELSPILAGIEDEIVKASCIKTVAQHLGVSEEAVIKQVGKYRTSFGQQSGQNLPSKAEEKSRREILEETLLGLILQSPNLEEFDGVFKTNKALRLVKALSEWGKEKFDPGEFAASLPAELKDFFGEVFFAYSDSSSLKIDEEIKEIKKEIEILDLREKILQITKDIAQKESTEDPETLKSLTKELDRMAKNLGKLEKE